MITLEEIRSVHNTTIEEDRDNPDDYAPGERYIATLEIMLEYNMKEEYSVFLNAAIALHTIVSKHPFVNGNKRTGFATADMILRNKGYYVTKLDDAKIQFIVDVARPEKNITIEDVEQWLINNTAAID